MFYGCQMVILNARFSKIKKEIFYQITIGFWNTELSLTFPNWNFWGFENMVFGIFRQIGIMVLYYWYYTNWLATQVVGTQVVPWTQQTGSATVHSDWPETQLSQSSPLTSEQLESCRKEWREAWYVTKETIVLFEKTALRLWSQRPMHVQGDAGHPG
jgi:hypothetical protein